MKVSLDNKQIKPINSLKHSISPLNKKTIQNISPPPFPEAANLIKSQNKSKFASSVQYFSNIYTQPNKNQFFLNDQKRFNTDSNQYSNHMHFSSCETTIKPELCKALLNQTISTEENNSTIKAGRYAHSMKNILDKPKPTITIKKGIRVPNCSVYLNNVNVNSTITKHNKSISTVLIEPKEANLKIINKEQITQPLIHNKQTQKINERNNNKNELSLLSTTHFNTNSNVYKTNKYFTPFIHDKQPIKTIEDQTIPIDKRDIPVTISNSKVEHKSHKHYKSSLSPNDKHTYSSKPTTITQNPKKKYGYECYKIMKSIYNKIKQEEKFYNPDFNYKYTDYDTINYSICYDNENDDNKLFSVCFELKEEILNTLAQLVDNFEKVKKSLINKHKITLEEKNLFYKEITTCKEAIRDYLVSSGNPNTNVYGTNDLVKIFKKTYTDFRNEIQKKIEEKEQIGKDLRSYKLMVNTYKQTIANVNNKLNSLKKENELLLMKINLNNNTEEINKEFILLKNEKLKMESLLKEQMQVQSTYNKNIVDAIKKLIVEINITSKIKEYLDIILKISGLNEKDINEIYLMKDSKKKVFIK